MTFGSVAARLTAGVLLRRDPVAPDGPRLFETSCPFASFLDGLGDDRIVPDREGDGSGGTTAVGISILDPPSSLSLLPNSLRPQPSFLQLLANEDSAIP